MNKNHYKVIHTTGYCIPLLEDIFQDKDHKDNVKNFTDGRKIVITHGKEITR